MRILIIATSLLIFIQFSLAIRNHFKWQKMPNAMTWLMAFGLCTYILYVFSYGQPYAMHISNAASLGFLLTSCCVFQLAKSASKAKTLPIAFSEVYVSSIVTSGVYKYVRHPFYLSYILFWIGCAISSVNAATAICFAALSAIYALLGLEEERRIRSSPQREEYEAYMRRSGFLFPKFFKLEPIWKL